MFTNNYISSSIDGTNYIFETVVEGLNGSYWGKFTVPDDFQKADFTTQSKDPSDFMFSYQDVENSQNYIAYVNPDEEKNTLVVNQSATLFASLDNRELFQCFNFSYGALYVNGDKVYIAGKFYRYELTKVSQ